MSELEELEKELSDLLEMISNRPTSEDRKYLEQIHREQILFLETKIERIKNG